MFRKRDDLVKFLVVAETGKIVAAADRLAITQPALSRVIARLEDQIKGQLLERIPTGVRLTPLGVMVADLARHVLREIEAAEETISLALAGHAGSFRVTTDPMWMQAVLPATIARFHETRPGVELKLQIASRKEGIRLLTNGESDLHCGGIDTNEPLPLFLRRDHFLDMTWGIVAHRDHPLHSSELTWDDLADYPWIDYDAPMKMEVGNGLPSVSVVLDDLHKGTGKRVRTIIRTDSVDLCLMGTGPYLSWLSLTFLDKLPGNFLKRLPLEFGTYRCRTGLVSRRSAERMPSFGYFRDIVRDIVLRECPHDAGGDAPPPA